MKLTPEQHERFWALVEVGDPDACWPWTRPPRPDGYGQIKMPGTPRPLLAHRVAYALTRTLGPTLRVLHACDFRLCCNPRHLRQGTDADNSRDMVRRRRNRRSDGSPVVAQLSLDTVRAIRSACMPGVQRQDVAAQFGVAKSTVSNIMNGRHWKGVE